MKKKIILVAALVAAASIFYVFDLGQYLTLESLKANRQALLEYYEANALTMALGYIGVYIVVVALSLPGATIMTLCGGAIFGAVKATLFINIGATVGATLAFLAARFILRDWVEEKFGGKLQKFNEGFSKNALNYILFLRLVPVFPFFLINLASGLTQIPLRTYVLGTMIGIIPGSFVFANAASNLAAIDSLSGIASPGVLGAFALLGLFSLIPTLYKKYKEKAKSPSVS